MAGTTRFNKERTSRALFSLTQFRSATRADTAGARHDCSCNDVNHDHDCLDGVVLVGDLGHYVAAISEPAGDRVAEPESARPDQFDRLHQSAHILRQLRSAADVEQQYGHTGTLKDGQISFGYSLESAASDVTLSVKDSSGNTVWTGSGTTTSGTNSFTWDGTATDGTQLTDGGQYTLNVSATDSTGQSVYGYTTVTGKVTSIDNSSGTPMLNIGSTSVSTSNVIGVTS
jgi:hypothetical protein